jgi:uncharacterized protein with NRDE domain
MTSSMEENIAWGARLRASDGRYHGPGGDTIRGCIETIRICSGRVCTLAIWLSTLPTLPLVIAANRDEFLDRPASAPTVLDESRRIVGGRDLRAGGTWLALAANGLVAGVLNRRTPQPPDPAKRSRGALLVDVLRCPSVDAAAAVLAALDGDAFNAFNLLVADAGGHAVVAQNQERAMRLTWLRPGVHLVTNLDVNDPTCPKIARSHRLFAAAGERFAVDLDRTAFRDGLRVVLSDHTTVLDPRLPDVLGAICVHADRFGTRSSQLVFRDEAGAFEHWFADGPPCVTAYQPAMVP